MEYSLRLGGAGFRPAVFFSRRLARHTCRSTSASASASASTGSYVERVQGLKGPLNAAMTSGVLSAMGDGLAQLLMRYSDEKAGKKAQDYDPWRALRMFGFGFCWYGPFQYYWYNALDWIMPMRNTVNFLTKVAANQLLLAPCVLTSVFSWNLALTNNVDAIPGKLKQDLVPSMINGWKFWIPAASINFYCIPLQAQVLYMSCCGLLWTAYLSYASVTPQAATAPAPAIPAPAPLKGKKKGRK